MFDYQLLSSLVTSRRDADGFTSFSYYTLAFILAAIFLTLVSFRGEGNKLKHIPTVGYQTPLLSYISAIRFLFSGHQMVQEGYYKYHGSIFKVPLLTRWEVIVTGKDLMEEFTKAPDDTLSIMEANADNMQADYTFGPEFLQDGYHIRVIQHQLGKNRNLKSTVLVLQKEIDTGFSKLIPATDKWAAYSPMETFIQMIAQNSNLIFVGPPLCYNPEFLEIVIGVTTAVVKLAVILGILPSFAKPLAGYVFPSVSRYISNATEHLTSIIEQRRRAWREQKGKEVEGNEMDFLTCLIEEEGENEDSTRQITNHILAINIASIHTTTMTFVHALFHLAARPEYIEPLRVNIEEAIDKEGWTKDALDKMHKVDSFIKETQRLTPIGALIIVRKATKDFTFSDGTFIPKGTRLSLPLEGVHLDEECYPDALQFDGFRFSKLTDSDNNYGRKGLGMVSTESTFLAFGCGKHLCPGRFFAADQLKLILANLLITYDLKLENKDGARPRDFCVSGLRIPNPFAKIMLRKRVFPGST